MANGLFEDRLKRKKKPGEVDIATLQQPKFPASTVETPAFREALTLPTAPESGKVTISPQPITAAGIRSIGGAPREEQPSALRKALAAPYMSQEQKSRIRAISPQQVPVAPPEQPRITPGPSGDITTTEPITGSERKLIGPIADRTSRLSETRRSNEMAPQAIIDLQSADVRRRLGIGAPLDITRQDVGYFVGPNTKIMERFDPETGDIRRYIASGVEREQKPWQYGATKEEIQKIKEQEQQELEKEKKLWGPRLEAFKAQQDSALRASPPGTPVPKRIDISGNIATDYTTGRRWDIGTGQTLTGQQVQIGPGGEKTTTLRFGGEQAQDLSKERLSSLTSRYNKAIEMAGKATTPDEKQQYEQIAASMEEQISNITEPRRERATRGMLAGGDTLQASLPPEQIDFEQQRAPIAAPPWQGLSPTAAMAKRTEVNNKLFQVKDAIESGDESIIRKYFSNPNDNEARYLFSLLSGKERSFIVERSK